MSVFSSLERNVYFKHITLTYHVCSVLSFLLRNHKIGLNKVERKLDSINQYTKTQPKLDVIRLYHFITCN